MCRLKWGATVFKTHVGKEKPRKKTDITRDSEEEFKKRREVTSVSNHRVVCKDECWKELTDLEITSSLVALAGLVGWNGVNGRLEKVETLNKFRQAI
jgi:hypothetical protein